MLDMRGDRLYDKYIIAKRDDSPIDPKAQYFVLRLDSDGCARAAAYVYARCISTEWPGLAEELRALLRRLSVKTKDVASG